MPNLRSSKKDLRKTKKRTLRNKAAKSRVKNIMKKIREASLEEAKKLLPEAYSIIDKTHQRGIIKKNTASRYKSRLMRVIQKKSA